MKNKINSIFIIVTLSLLLIACKKNTQEDIIPVGQPTDTVAIGQSHKGGIIAYILQPGDPGYDANAQHGLIAAPYDLSTSIKWYNGVYAATGIINTEIGSGNTNTNSIISSQGAGNYAAKICADLAFGGYDDWYLPAKDELVKLFLSKNAIGGFAAANYWSSTESDANSTWYEDFSDDGLQNVGDKSFQSHVRAIRSF